MTRSILAAALALGAGALLHSVTADACTIFVVDRDGEVLVGNNLDTRTSKVKAWFIPAEEGRHGRMCLGHDKDFRIAEGGVNDQGLFIGVNALNYPTGWKPDPAKPDWETWEGWFESGVPDGILAMCATVEEALAIFETYNLLTFDNVKYLMADRSGDSAVLEWNQGAMQVLRRDGDHQVSTNFVTSAYEPENVPCARYKIAERILSDGTRPNSVDLIRSVLSATAFENGAQTPTQYSNIFNLTTGRVHTYLFHNFEEVWTIDLRQELARGPSRHVLADLFPVRSYAYTLYRK